MIRKFNYTGRRKIKRTHVHIDLLRDGEGRRFLNISLQLTDMQLPAEAQVYVEAYHRFYFDQVCPPDSVGNRKPGRDYRHILEPGYPYGHRHLIGGAYLVYAVYGLGDEISQLLLYTPLHIESQFNHEFVSRQSLITNKGIMEAAFRLYFDPASKKPKRGAQLKKGAPGTLYRFIDVIQQLDVNYDLYSMIGDEIIGILPAEFDKWKL